MTQAPELLALLVAGSGLCGWWLAVRPGASYRGVATSVSVLIILMGALLCALAICGQSPENRGGDGRPAQASQVLTP